MVEEKRKTIPSRGQKVPLMVYSNYREINWEHLNAHKEEICRDTIFYNVYQHITEHTRISPKKCLISFLSSLEIENIGCNKPFGKNYHNAQI